MRAELALAVLLDHPDSGVRAWAGACLIFVLPDRVVPILREITAKEHADSAHFTAYVALVRWTAQNQWQGLGSAEDRRPFQQLSTNLACMQAQPGLSGKPAPASASWIRGDSSRPFAGFVTQATIGGMALSLFDLPFRCRARHSRACSCGGSCIDAAERNAAPSFRCLRAA